MKMNEVFKKPVMGVDVSENDCGSDEYRLSAKDENGGFYATFYHRHHADAAYHAINCHDELVAENAAYEVEMLNHYYCEASQGGADHDKASEYAKMRLANFKAKG